MKHASLWPLLATLLACGYAEPVRHELTERPANLDLLKRALDEAPEGGWVQLGDTRIPLVTAKELRAVEERSAGNLWGRNGSKAVIRGWNGAAFDPEEQLWYFFGGGSKSYGGNEVYVFDFRSLRWSRRTEPSPLVHGGDGCPMPADGPPAMRTFDGILWNPDTKSVWVFGDSPFCMTGDPGEPSQAWELDPRARRWRAHELGVPTKGAKTIWNPDTRRIVVYPRDRAPYEVDGEGNVHRRAPAERDPSRVGVMDYDPRRRRAVGLQHRGRKALFELSLDGDPLGSLESLEAVAPLPPELLNQRATEGGMAYHAPSGTFVLWPGGSEVWSFSPETHVFRRYDNPSPGGPELLGDGRVYSKWIYLAEVDAFAGYADPAGNVWLYRLPRASTTVDPKAVRACRNDDCSYRSVERALAQAEDGDTVRILPGKYRDGGLLKASRVRILAEGAHLYGTAFRGKAALVIQGDDVVIEGLECSEIRVPDMNGGCVRAEGRNLTLRRVHFHDAQTGLLSGNTKGSLVIEDSTVERMGKRPGRDGNPHGLYIGHADEFVLRRSRVIGSVGEGHEVKSRAKRTIIENNVIASLDANDSRLIDVPNGGDVVIRGNVLEKGPASSNDDLIGIGLERGRRPEGDHVLNRTLVEGNTMIVDRPGRVLLVHSRDVPEALMRDNLVVGGPRQSWGDDRWVHDRDAAGIAPYPFLPEIEPGRR